jgi:RNA polymerase sigma-70 factor (ECF subfamily)
VKRDERGEKVTDFEKVYNEYFNDVYLYIKRLSGDEHIAEEITSETFFKALKAIDSFRGECEIRVWLCQIAKNSYYTYINKNSKIQKVEEDKLLNLPDNKNNVADEVASKIQAQAIQKILEELEEPYKEVFMWRVYAELSFKEIAGIFNKNENWACVTYHRARNQIKKRLEEKRK